MRFQCRFQVAFCQHRSNKFCSGLQCSFHTAQQYVLLSLKAELAKDGTLLYRIVNDRLITFCAHFADAENGKEIPSCVICIYVFT